MPQNVPRGNPLENYGRENRAAPKPGQPQVHDFARTVYDDEVTALRPEILSSSEVAPQHIDPTRLTPPELGGSGSGNSADLGQKTLSTEEKDQCPFGDTRWPPPNVSISKPLHLLGLKGEKPIYYHLVYENSSPQADFWKGPLKAQATTTYAEKGLALSISKEGKSKKEMKAANRKRLRKKPRKRRWKSYRLRIRKCSRN
jgi:hypothetical protein